MKNKWIRKDLKDYVPYHAPQKPYELKLDANESPFGLTDKTKEKIMNWLRNSENLNRYPDTDNTELREALGIYWNVTPENITCGVGSDQLIDYITKVFLENNDAIVTPAPTFSMYALTTLMNKGRVVEVAFGSECGFQTDADKLIRTVKSEKAKILFLCTPNNPSGNSMTKEQMIEILENVDCPVVVDEAYGEFSKETMIPFIHTYDNLIVLKTFSKAFGLAGARVGYAIASTGLIDAIDIAKSPFNLPTLSQLLAVEALKESDIYEERIAYLIEQREILMNKLANIPWLRVYPSGANFILVESEKKIAEALEAKGVLVRYFPTPKVDGIEQIRLTVGTQYQNDLLLEFLKKI